MKFYQQIPFFRLVTPFVVGIIFGAFLPFNIKFWWLFLLISSVVTITIGLSKYLNKNYNIRWIYGAVLTLSLFLNGYFLTIGNIDVFSNQHIGNQINKKSWMLIRVTNPPEEKENSYKISAEVKQFKDSLGWKNAQGKIIAYFQKTDKIEEVNYGDLLLINVTLDEVNPPKNPGEFNYKRYLGFYNIYHQAYVHQNDWINTNENNGFIVFRWSNSLRTYLLKILKNYGVKGNEFAVASALILGYKGALEENLLRAYSSAGATHVLAVSGLHVGIIFVILNNLLKFLEKIKRGNIIKAIVLIGFLWFYALLTGLSPSVMRAATMFSFIVIGKATNKNTNIYNTLAVSAFFLLIINPLLIMEVGFQLSYLAVVGIVYLQPKIYTWYNSKYWLIDKMWELTAVSIAAQIVTFPLGLLYFHQFPNYFFISNLVVIPLATLIVYGGITLFFVSWIPFVALWVAKILNGLIWSMNYCVQFIESIPYSLTEGLTINITETWMIYLIIITFLVYFAYKEAKYLQVALGCLLMLVSYQLYQGITQVNQSKFLVYDVSKTTAIEFVSGKSATLYADSNLINNDKRLLFHIKHNWWELGIDRNKLIGLKSNEKLFYKYKGKKIVVLFNEIKNHSKKYDTDILILSKIKYLNSEQLLNNYNFNKLVFDSTIPKWLAKKWIKEAKKLNIDIYSTSLSGAFVENI